MNLRNLQTREWHSGQILAFSGLDGRTDFQGSLVGRTRLNGIDLKLPGRATILFEGDICDVPLWGGDFFEVQTTCGLLRGAFIDGYHLLIEGPCRMETIDSDICYLQNGERLLTGSRKSFDETLINIEFEQCFYERQKWITRQKILERISRSSLKPCYKALSQMKTQVYTAEGVITHRWTTPDRWPHRSMWLWDSVFHAIGWRHIDINLAREMLTAVFDNQREDGFIPHQMDPSGTSSITQPPLLAFGVSMVQEILPESDWIDSLYPKLCKYLEWDLINRDTDGSGLCEWFIEENPLCRSGENGMDNSPRFDNATQLDAVDFNSYLARECEVMAGFAQLLNLPDDVVKWQYRYEHLCQLINTRLWSEEQGFYLDYDISAGKCSDILAVSGFLPLFCKAASERQVASLVRHLNNPKTFGTSFPVPSIAAGDTAHYSKDMWRGPSWINTNWLIIYGLERYGLKDLADQLREKTIQVIEDMFQEYGTFFEYYDDQLQVPPPQLLRKGQCAPEASPYHQVIHDYGWTATLYLDLILNK